VLNWLALAGWGTTTDASTETAGSAQSKTNAPDSTTVMTLPNLIENVGQGALSLARADPILV
jgi:hypothetical protein